MLRVANETAQSLPTGRHYLYYLKEKTNILWGEEGDFTIPKGLQGGLSPKVFSSYKYLRT